MAPPYFTYKKIDKCCFLVYPYFICRGVSFYMGILDIS